MFMLHIFNAYDTMEVHQPSNYHIVQEKKKDMASLRNIYMSHMPTNTMQTKGRRLFKSQAIYMQTSVTLNQT